MPQRSAGAPSVKDNKDAGLAPGDRPRRGDLQGPEVRSPTLNPRGLEPGSSLDRLDQELQAMFSGTPGDDRITTPTQISRPGRRPPNEEDRPGLLGPGPGPEEEEPLLAGDPTNLGARARRRRTIDEVNNPPLLRRGLLGV